jgi:inorganic pyrophosphatase
MSLKHVGPGRNAPDEINVVVEIPAQTGPVKYEVDKASGAVFVDRFMATSMFYPCNYGYVPDSLADDGDPIDVMVVTPYPLIAGTVITCRPIGVLEMDDEAGDDAKIVAVPITRVARIYQDIQTAADLPAGLVHTIEHFFAHYKDLEPGKWVKVRGWGTADDAREYISQALARYQH